MHELGLLPICFKKNLLKLDKILDLLAVFKVKIFNISLFHIQKIFRKIYGEGQAQKRKSNWLSDQVYTPLPKQISLNEFLQLQKKKWYN